MKYVTTIFLACISFLACQKNIQSNAEQKKEFQTIIEFRDIPDSLILNKQYYSKIYYESVLDSVELQENDNHFILLYLTTAEGTFKEVEEIEQVNHRIFIYNDSINTFDFDFEIKNPRLNTVKGIIEDMVILENHYKDGKSRIITNLHVIQLDCKVYPQKQLLYKTAYNNGYDQ